VLVRREIGHERHAKCNATIIEDGSELVLASQCQPERLAVEGGGASPVPRANDLRVLELMREGEWFGGNCSEAGKVCYSKMETFIVIARLKRFIPDGKLVRCWAIQCHMTLLVACLIFTAWPLMAANHCSVEILVIETSLDPSVGVEVKVISTPGGQGHPQISARNTNAAGIAKFNRLNPNKTPQLLFGITASGPRSGTALVDLRKQCHGTYKVVLPDKIPSTGADR
jgi:hypothetical protein